MDDPKPASDPETEGHVTNNADSQSDQSETVADQGKPAAPEHEVDQSAPAVKPAAPEHLVDPPPSPAEAFPRPIAPEPVSSQVPNQQPLEGQNMVQWLGVRGQPTERAELRLADNPNKVYHPGEEVPLTDAQVESLRQSGDHLFLGDPGSVPVVAV